MSEQTAITHSRFEWIFDQFNQIAHDQQKAIPTRKSFVRPSDVPVDNITLIPSIVSANYDMHPQLFGAFVQSALSSTDTAIVQKIKELIVLMRLKDDGTDSHLEVTKGRVYAYQRTLDEYLRNIKEDEERVRRESDIASLNFQKHSLENINNLYDLIRAAYDQRGQSVWSEIVIEEVENELFIFGNSCADDIIEVLDRWSHMSLQNLISSIVRGHKRWFIQQLLELTENNFKLSKSNDRYIKDLFDHELNKSMAELHHRARLENALSQAKMEIVQRFYDKVDGYDHIYNIIDVTVDSIPELRAMIEE